MNTLDKINKALENGQSRNHRKHLGASIIGKPCKRELWYTFRHAKLSTFEGRMLRLFQRGHDEEPRFIALLDLIGVKSWEIDEKTNKQFQISDHGGHFGGSLDGIAFSLPEAPNEYSLLEFKTHGKASFNKLKDGVLIAKPEHHMQMQIYMHYMGLKQALYMAVCKDNDELHLEMVNYVEWCAMDGINKAKEIITAMEPPEKEFSSSSCMACKFCDYSAICWKGEEVESRCRNCEFAQPLNGDGAWRCNAGKEFGTLCGSYSKIKGL